MSVKESYNEWSNQYDSNRNRTRDLDKRVTKSVLQGHSFSSALEIGCGTGKNTPFISSITSQVVATDFSSGMLALARQNVTAKNVTFTESDITNHWQSENNQHDLISCNLVLEHIENLEHVFLEARRCLKNGGLLFISELHPFRQYAGSQAKFEQDGVKKPVSSHIHDISAYLDHATHSGFSLMELQEWRSENANDITPRILSLLFKAD